MGRNINDLLGKDAEYLLKHRSKTILKDQLHTPGPNFINQVFAETNCNTQVLRSIHTKLTSDHPINLCRYQIANCYMGRAGLVCSGGESKGSSDLADAVRVAVINKRAEGIGLTSRRKSVQRPMKEGVEILNAIQDVYLDKSIGFA